MRGRAARSARRGRRRQGIAFVVETGPTDAQNGAPLDVDDLILVSELAGASVPDHEIHQITWQHSCRFFDWDPFAVVARAQATASSLPARSADVDTTTRSKVEWRRRYAAAVA